MTCRPSTSHFIRHTFSAVTFIPSHLLKVQYDTVATDVEPLIKETYQRTKCPTDGPTVERKIPVILAGNKLFRSFFYLKQVSVYLKQVSVGRTNSLETISSTRPEAHAVQARRAEAGGIEVRI